MIESIINPDVNSIEFIRKLPKEKWINISDIPYNIFWSVWDWIETTNTVILHSKESCFLILPKK